MAPIDAITAHLINELAKAVRNENADRVRQLLRTLAAYTAYDRSEQP